MKRRRLTRSDLEDALEQQKMQLVIALDNETLDHERVLELSRRIRATREALAEDIKKMEKKP